MRVVARPRARVYVSRALDELEERDERRRGHDRAEQERTGKRKQRPHLAGERARAPPLDEPEREEREHEHDRVKARLRMAAEELDGPVTPPSAATRGESAAR